MIVHQLKKGVEREEGMNTSYSSSMMVVRWQEEDERGVITQVAGWGRRGIPPPLVNRRSFHTPTCDQQR